MLLPKDPYILLSFLNARLRDQYADLEDLCASLDADEQSCGRRWRGLTIATIPFIISLYRSHQRRFENVRLPILQDRCRGDPSSKVYEDDVCYAFNDIDPQAPTHFLVVPKAHIGSVSEITADNSTVVAHIFEVIAKLTKEKGWTATGWSPTSASRRGRACFICTSMY